MFRLKSFISVLTLFSQISSNEAGRQACGGTYTATRGILATPNFPGQFDVPIRCQWVIDSSNAAYASGNTSIIVYFTQLFTFEGLTFTEYQLYGNDYKINPRLIHKVNETNVFRTRWIQSYQSYLVIELKMQSSESAHIRVLDKFLDTYGFNITYEITTAGVRSPSCTMMDCGFTGICFDHYTKFSCNCFEGYSGPSCSEGPKSFCYTNGTPTCKNGGTCLHVGVAAVKCHCSKLFMGNTCETLMEPASAKGLTDCSNCASNCTNSDGIDLACNCFNGKVYTPNQLGVFATLHLGNLPSLPPSDLKRYLKLQLLKHLRTNLSKIEDLTIANLIHYMSGADVTFQVVGSKKEEKKVKNVLNKWVDRGFVGNITVAEKDNSIKTPLSIQSVDINQPGVIRENDEFILSCVARGSPSMTFRWFKDGAFVNLTYARHKWIKLIKDPHVTDQYTALLAVGTARKYDEGKFTCQVEDFNIQQCKSKFVKVKRPPLVKIEPMSLTVRKGQNFTVKCVTLEGNGGIIGKYTYSWTKNKELLPVRTDSERYETLYPAGTILQVFGIEKDVHFSCLVQDSLTSSERSIQVHFLDKQVRPCPNETKYGLTWPETAPDTEYIQECPKDYTGIISRKCMLSNGKTPAWGAPDFSQCTGEFLREVYEQFEVLKYGYGSASIESLFSGFLHYSSSIKLRPGEGTRILVILNEMLDFLKQTKLGKHTIQNLTQSAVSVLDIISSSSDALLRAKDINLLQMVLFHQLEISGFYLAEQDSSKTINFSFDALDIAAVRETSTLTMLYGPATSKTPRSQSWVSARVRAQRLNPIYSDLLVGIVYRNLSLFFPPKLFLRNRDETEIQYQIFSQIVTCLPISLNRSKNGNVSMKIDFQHNFNTDLFNASSNERWEVRCGYADMRSFAYDWDIYTCTVESIDKHSSTCVCSEFGSYVLILLLAQPLEVTVFNAPHKYVLISSFFLGIILTTTITFCLGISAFLTKNSCLVYLKLQYTISIFFCEVLFAIAILVEPPQQYLMVFQTFLEMFMLVGISSHLSKLLIVFTELTEEPKSVSSKYTVVGIISGVPLITVFGNHLTYKTMNLRLRSWWLLENSLSLNIFLAVILIVTILFIFIYFSVTNKLQELIASRKKHEEAAKIRISLIRRAGCLFGMTLTFVVSSILYINNQNSIWSIYQFGGTNMLLNLMLIVCYVLKSETNMKDLFRKKPQKENRFFSVDSSGPLHFSTKQDAELCNQSAPNRHDIQLISLKTTDTSKSSISKTQSISNAFESCLQTSSTFCDLTVNESAAVYERELQSHKTSPPLNKKQSSVNCLFQSPDILTSYVGLDLVACTTKSEQEELAGVPRLQPALKAEKKPGEHKTVRIMFPPQVIITPDDAISKILEAGTVADQSPRTQPDGHAETLSHSEEVKELQQQTSASKPRQVSFKEDNLDGVLDSISHDLDYLLNRDDGLATEMAVRKVSKPPGASVVNKIPEQLVLHENSSSPEGIMLRTNC